MNKYWGCPKCGGGNIKEWYSGGRRKVQCLDCLWRGLFDSLKKR